MTTIDWESTIESIRGEKCILFLGPEIFASPKGGTLNERMLSYLGQQMVASKAPTVENQSGEASESKEEVPQPSSTEILEAIGIKYHTDGLFYFSSGPKRTQTCQKIRQFFRKEAFPEADAIFEKLVQIPFHLIFSVTPDQKLISWYDELNYPVNKQYFHKNNTEEKEDILPTKDHPLVYNLLGSMEDRESLVLSHKDLFDYLKSVLGSNTGIPEKLQEKVNKQAEHIIFLGIEFEKWYMQLLLRILELHDDPNFLGLAAVQSVSEEIQTLYKNEFKIDFINHNILEFIEELHAQCAQTGCLKPVVEKPKVDASSEQDQQDFINRMIERISTGDIEIIFKEMIPWFRAVGKTESRNELISISARFSRLEKNNAKGLYTTDQYVTEYNKISDSVLHLLNDLASE